MVCCIYSRIATGNVQINAKLRPKTFTTNFSAYLVNWEQSVMNMNIARLLVSSNNSNDIQRFTKWVSDRNVQDVLQSGEFVILICTGIETCQSSSSIVFFTYSS